jgi:hypothetical protein
MADLCSVHITGFRRPVPLSAILIKTSSPNERTTHMKTPIPQLNGSFDGPRVDLSNNDRG